MKKILLVLTFFVVTLFAGDITYELYRGWNNISVPCNLYGEPISDYFPYTGYVFRFNSASMSYDVLTNVPAPQHGFWLLVEIDTTISFECGCITNQCMNNGIYISDWYNHRIVRMNDIDGSGWTTFGTHGSGVNQLDGPQDCKVGPDGRIYIIDRGNNRVVRIDDMDGTNWTTTPSSLGLYWPRQLSFDDEGRIYIADVINDRIVRVDDITGAGMESWGSGILNEPGAVRVGPDSKIYISDTYNNRMVRIDDMSGSGLEVFGSSGTGVGNFNTLRSFCFDDDGKIYIADRGNYRIVRINDFSETGWVFFGSLGTGVNEFENPDGIHLDCEGRIYIGGDDRIVRIDDMSGSGWITFGRDGTGIGEFQHTHGIFVDKLE